MKQSGAWLTTRALENIGVRYIGRALKRHTIG